MLTMIFILCMLAVFGRLAIFALKGAWGLAKIFFSLIFLPFILIGLVLKGLIAFALPILIIYGIFMLIRESGAV